MDTSDEEQYGQKERIPTLQPGHFDGTGPWKDFLYQFESCAKANRWIEKTKAVQLKFSLRGAAGAIVHKNPKSDRWSYLRMVEEIEAAYGPRSEHAAAIGIELRQRVRRPGEALHTLRDDIYEKVSIVYANRTELEQDCICVEVFTNALADAEVVQKLLEERPYTLAKAYEIAHRYETTRRAARAVTQLMRPGGRGFAAQATRTATVREAANIPVFEQVPGATRFNKQQRPYQNKFKKTNFNEVICHNCSGVGHLKRNCPSPYRSTRSPGNATFTSTPDPSTVVICTKSPVDEMCVQIMIHGLEICALLDSGARRNVLPLHHFNSLPTQFRPPVQPSVAQILQGIGPEGLVVLGEVILPVHIGNSITQVNFIMADTTQSTEVILGHPFLLQAQARLDYGRKEITLFGEKVPDFYSSQPSETHLVRVARTTVLEAGCEYVVPGISRLRSAAGGTLMLSPVKGFIERHQVLVARAVLQARQAASIPIRVFNPGAIPVTLKRGAVAGVLQQAQVLAEAEPQSSKTPDLGRTNIVQHDIITIPGPPVKQAPRRMNREKQVAADQQVQQSLDTGVAQPSNSSWAAPIVMDTLDTLSTAKYFSTLDLTSGYWQVEMTPRARKAAAFCTRKGLFEWNVMPFGLCNAPATFQRLMDRVLMGLQWETCLVYLDDIIILGRDSAQMLERLEQVLIRLRLANLKLKPSKCCLFREKVAYLGHIVSAGGVATDPQKIQQVEEWPAPQNVSEVRQFVGLASYYRRFVENFATIARPLHELTQKYARFHWTPECQEAFDRLKKMLTSAPVLGYPLDDGDFFLDTDASDWGIGAVLSQVQGEEERVLAYGSRRLSATEQNYCTTRRELLAVVEFTTHFRQYLLGRPFTVRTDHSSLRWLTRLREPEGQLARWLEKLAEYDFQVIHRPGKNHQNADALSRRPCRASCPCTVPEPDFRNIQHKGVQCDLGDVVLQTLTCTGHPPVGVVEPELCVGEKRTSAAEFPIVGVEGFDLDTCTAVLADHPIIRLVSESSSNNLFHGWTQEQLKTAQMTDPDIAPIRVWKEEGCNRPPWADIAAHSPATKAYWAQWKRLCLRDGILLRKFYCSELKVFYPQILLPRTFRNSVMEQLHEGAVGGHFGAEKTLARLKTRYHWYNMRDDVTLWCRTCVSCAAKARPRKTPRAAMGTVQVGAPMERIAVDLMGPLNETERHNRFILVVQDYFSKWVEAYPVPNELATTVAEKIVSEWVCRYGAPRALHSDQGSNFESAVFRGMCELLGIEKTRTTPFHPQSDGQVERFNATLQKALATMSERCHWDWDLMIPYSLMAYRATKHSSTGLTPNMMLFGREITEPVDLVVGLPPGENDINTIPEYVMQLRQQLELAHQLAREALGKSSERAKKQYDKNICQVQYQIGAAVWHLIKGTKRVKNKVRKFLPAYEGPYFIVGVLDDLIYRIQKSPRSKTKVVHHDKLKPFHSRTPLDNSWVFHNTDVPVPLEVLTPSTDNESEDIGPLNLWDTSAEEEELVVETPRDASSPGGVLLFDRSAQPPLDEEVTESVDKGLENFGVTTHALLPRE
ncbi:uncharacterized protein LOC114461699 [Gouania willdenowi]|uniref:uncharacterized protein LOC114461699 n=1 Tax=Gouania willdenowi TaxID=441366 RepID=UPI001054CDF2|nr:uncharacterized protein LOC114461699 [Gouania willdenowi]